MKRRSLYSAHELYRLAFAYRNVRVEVAALMRWFKLATGSRKAPQSVLEFAAGPAEHAIAFAQRGIDTTALDLSPTMCRFARQEARKHGVKLHVIQADMIDFRLRRQYDFAFTMADSLNNIHRTPDLVKHFRSVAASLVDGGIYIIELEHHEKKGEPLKPAKWRVTKNGITVNVFWRPLAEKSNGRTVDVSLEIQSRNNGEVTELTDVLNLRTWSVSDIQKVVSRIRGLEIVTRYGDFRNDMPGNDTSPNCILVVQKCGSE